jgi:hypothetical protein
MILEHGWFHGAVGNALFWMVCFLAVSRVEGSYLHLLLEIIG